jgi:hypothetical protein
MGFYSLLIGLNLINNMAEHYLLLRTEEKKNCVSLFLADLKDSSSVVNTSMKGSLVVSL